MTAIAAGLRVVVTGGGPESGSGASRRYEAVRALLDKGYAVDVATSASSADSRADAVVDLDHAPTGEPAALTGIVDQTREARGLPAGGAWKPWFPVIDYDRCTNCMQCLSFCLFDVYGVSADRQIQVQNQSNCKTECPACSRVCPEVAIMFPKYRHGPINGEEVNTEDIRREAMKVDISALLGGDIYQALRDRSARAKSRFSKERDDERALKERQSCFVKLQQSLDVPAEVLAALPSVEEIRAKAEAAAARAREATADVLGGTQEASEPRERAGGAPTPTRGGALGAPAARGAGVPASAAVRGAAGAKPPGQSKER